MTREEAIKWLKDHHSIDLNTQDDEAHRMAIEALEGKDTNVLTKWIPVSEKLPSGEALCCNDKGDMMIGYLSRDDYYGCVVATWGIRSCGM